MLSLLAQRELSRAAHLLQSTGVADPTDATANILRSLLCPNPQQPPPSRAWVDKRKDIAAGFSRRHFFKALQKASNGGICDITGWYYEHLRLAL